MQKSFTASVPGKNMATCFEVYDDGTSVEVKMSSATLSSDKTFCIVDGESNNIYLWKGRTTGVRKKFIGAQVASNLRVEHGFKFKVKPLDEGEEPEGFFGLLG